MSKNDVYILSFILTVIAAVFLWSLAIIVYRNNKKEYLNRTLALAMVFIGVWVLSGFAEKIFVNPSNSFTLWTYKWAYFSSILGSAFFFLFSLGLYLDRRPAKKTRYTISIASFSLALFSLSPYVIQSASFRNAVSTSQNGPLYPVVVTAIVLLILSGTYLIYRKRRNSTGIDRARTSIILYSMIIFFPIAAACTFLIPPLLGNDTSTSYASLAGIIPMGCTSYALIRLRLLDFRIIIRKTGVFIIGTIVLSIPVILIFFLFSAMHLNPFVEKGLTFLVFMIMVFSAPSILQYIRSLSSRLFFSDLYDELQLLDIISHRLVSQGDLKSGLLSALSEIVSPLGIKQLGVVIPRGIINENIWSFVCELEDNGTVTTRNDSNFRYMEWLDEVTVTTLTEELQRRPDDAEKELLATTLAASGLAACVPIRVSTERVGYCLVGEKVSNQALSSTDISLLEKSAEHLGLFIYNYALAAKLDAQLKELKEVYSELQEAYQFKSEIIEVTSHEFRTPVTLINGFTETLLNRWDELDESEKRSFLNDINNACSRIINLTDQFFSVSSLREGKLSIQKEPVRLADILRALYEALSPEERTRVTIEADPHLYFISDSDHLKAILKNVLDNALRFSSSDNCVIIKAWKTSSNGFIQIQDFGNGIPSKETEQVFEPFVRLESLNHHSKGMGLGLYIVRLLSSRLGIEVEIDSSEGIGTTITLTIGLDYDFGSSALRSSLSRDGTSA